MPKSRTILTFCKHISGPPMSDAPVLQLSDLNAWYGESHVLHGVDLRLNTGEVVCLLGRNGAGKTTILRSIMGLLGRREGEIAFRGRQIADARPETIARLGIGYCPEERGIFYSLTARENLMMPPVIAKGGISLDEIYELFPNLLERLSAQSGARLSGGEQQMLAIARVLRTGAKLLLLDEPTEGLAPVIVQQIARCVKRLKELGFTVLLVEQNFYFASELADRHYVIEHGKVVGEYTRETLKTRADELKLLLGV